MKNSSKGSSKAKWVKNLKTFTNRLWIIGTVFIFIIIVASSVVTIAKSNKATKATKIKEALFDYNANYYGYVPSGAVGNRDIILNSKYVSTPEVATLIETLDTTSDSCVLLDYFDISYLSLVNPIEDIETLIPQFQLANIQAWQIEKEGLLYFGDATGTYVLSEQVVHNSASDDIDGMLSDLKTVLDNRETIMFVSPLTKIYLTKDLCESIAELDLNDVDYLILQARILEGVGFNSIELSGLLDNYKKLR